jgi:glycosyltransferase involved in cell wall biosynthesis
LRVALLIHELGRSGGVSTILRYAGALEHCELVVTDPRAGELPAQAGDGLPLRRLADVREEHYDVAIATWWATAAALWEVRAERRLVFLQSIESRFYEERHFYERFAAEQVLALPAGFIVVAEWMREVLAELRPDAPVEVVRGGVDKEVFGRRPAGGAPGAAPGEAAGSAPASGSGSGSGSGSAAPLRVLVEGQPSLWFKGVHDAVAATRAMTEPAEVTVVASDPSAAGGLDGVRVVGGLDPSGMAALYAEHDVLLKLSRVESLGLAPIEAFHAGVPAVVAPYTGHEEYLRHGVNGLVVGHDDMPGTARALDRLARDPALRARLAEGALATASGWPAAEDSAAGFAQAVRTLAEGPEPDAAAAVAYLRRAQTRWLELGREHARQEHALAEGRRRALDWYEDAYAQARDHVEELNAALREADRLARDLQGQIEAVKASRAYRVATAARRLKPGGGS